ncbi:hypothetical protein T484DRAFT_3114419 [Baffinella frigidus]|nr:hypothetical protein T484DRAFT_3114419 [Cryptophyta sp. CCMP2293]
MSEMNGLIGLIECCVTMLYCDQVEGEEEGEPDADGGQGGSGAAGGDAEGSPNGGGEIPQNLVMSGASPGFSARFPIPQQPLGAPRATPPSLPPHSAFRGRADEAIHPFPLPAARNERGSGDRDAADKLRANGVQLSLCQRSMVQEMVAQPFKASHVFFDVWMI